MLTCRQYNDASNNGLAAWIAGSSPAMTPRFVALSSSLRGANATKQSSFPRKLWIASLSLAMTTRKTDLAALRASELYPPPRFRKIPPHKREAKRRKAHDSHCRAERGCAPLRGRARLPAPHRGTHHRLSPRWLCSRTGFPQSTAPAVFCLFAERRPELSTLRADRSFCRSTGDPEPPGCGLAIPPAGTASRSAPQVCLSGKAPLVSETEPV
jgi:hypothetical protein